MIETTTTTNEPTYEWEVRWMAMEQALAYYAARPECDPTPRELIKTAGRIYTFLTANMEWDYS